MVSESASRSSADAASVLTSSAFSSPTFSSLLSSAVFSSVFAWICSLEAPLSPVSFSCSCLSSVCCSFLLWISLCISARESLIRFFMESMWDFSCSQLESSIRAFVISSLIPSNCSFCRLYSARHRSAAFSASATASVFSTIFFCKVSTISAECFFSVSMLESSRSSR